MKVLNEDLGFGALPVSSNDGVVIRSPYIKGCVQSKLIIQVFLPTDSLYHFISHTKKN